ncbi:hypothetical protein FACS1894176_11190 [Bacteroidia bacterium]|nr:hypothetical protein FACS1894176_11190 [Bacteroidia bacterium]
MVRQAFVLIDKDDTGNFAKLAFKQKIQQAINILSDNYQYGEPNEKDAMSICASILRRAFQLDVNNKNSIKKAQVISLLSRIGM